MKQKHHPLQTTIFLMVTLLVSVSGINCSLIKNQEKIDQKMKEISEKKEKYNALQRDIAHNKLAQGTSCSLIKQTYGSPDDVLQSGSANSNFEIWTYEKIYEKGEGESWQFIRLYCDNDKLISWKY